MTQTDDDKKVIRNLDYDLKNFSKSVSNLSSYVANCNTKTKIDYNSFKLKAFRLSSDIKKLNNFKIFNKKAGIFLEEAVKFVNLVQKSNLSSVKKFIKNSKYLFKGACAIGHVDFIAYKKK